KGLVYQSANVCALSDLWRVGLAGKSQLSVVLNNVRSLHFCGSGRGFDVAARSGDHGFASSRLPQGCGDRGALSHHGEMDAGLQRLLGLHRLWSVHAHLVCEHPGGDSIFYRPEHTIVVGAEHAIGDRSLLYSFPDFAHALHQEASASALYCGRMDSLHANAGRLSHCAALVTRHRFLSEHLGFAFAYRDRRDARFCLSTTCTEDFIVSRARPASDRISANSKLKWPAPNLFARLRIPERRCPHGWE